MNYDHNMVSAVSSMWGQFCCLELLIRGGDIKDFRLSIYLYDTRMDEWFTQDPALNIIQTDTVNEKEGP